MVFVSNLSGRSDLPGDNNKIMLYFLTFIHILWYQKLCLGLLVKPMSWGTVAESCVTLLKASMVCCLFGCLFCVILYLAMFQMSEKSVIIRLYIWEFLKNISIKNINFYVSIFEVINKHFIIDKNADKSFNRNIDTNFQKNADKCFYKIFDKNSNKKFDESFYKLFYKNLNAKTVGNGINFVGVHLHNPSFFNIFIDIYNINCDRILDKDLDNIPEFFINSSVICTFVYLYNCTLLENLPTLTISESHPLKNYLPTCSYFKSLFKIYSLKKHFLKELFLKIHIF